MTLSRVTAVLVMMTAIVWPSATTHAAARSMPTLSMVPVSGYSLAVKGIHWPAADTVEFLAQVDGNREIVRVQATHRGTFLVGVKMSDLCGAVQFEAADALDTRVDLHGPRHGCSSPVHAAHLQLMVLKGRRIPSRRLSLFGPTPSHGPISVSVGDRIYLWEPGRDLPAFFPRADPAYLQHRGQGRTVDQDCSGMPAASPAQCNAGFYWEWMAVRSGRSLIDLSPACRQTKPACGAPDMEIEVQIDE